MEKKEIKYSVLNEYGEEINDPEPLFIDVAARRRPSLTERVKSMVQMEFSRIAERDGMESFDEANDFDVLDDFEVDDPITQYEEKFLQEEYMVPMDVRPNPKGGGGPPPEGRKKEEDRKEGEKDKDKKDKEDAGDSTVQF